MSDEQIDKLFSQSVEGLREAANEYERLQQAHSMGDRWVDGKPLAYPAIVRISPEKGGSWVWSVESEGDFTEMLEFSAFTQGDPGPCTFKTWGFTQ